MAARRRNSTGYDTYGSVAYAPVYDGSAVRAPRREEELHRSPRPQTRERRHTQKLTRTQVQVREAGQVAPFAVVGFLAVAVFAVLLLGSHAQLTVEYGEMVNLRSELTTLQAENANLTAQYERVFDMSTIKAAVGDTMVRPTSDQIEYIDLSEPDAVEVFSDAKGGNVIANMAHEVTDFLGGVIEYFR